MNDETFEFNQQLELDVLLNGLTDVTVEYVVKFDRYNLDDVVIPNGIMCIGRCAFEDCKSLKSVMIANTVTDIGDDAFIRCKNLTSITIPASVTRIGSYAFTYCNSFINATFNDKTYDDVRSMDGYPWDLSSLKIDVQVNGSKITFKKTNVQ